MVDDYGLAGPGGGNFLFSILSLTAVLTISRAELTVNVTHNVIVLD